MRESNSESMRQERNCDERGAILLLVVLAAGVIIGFAALGIDTYRITSAATEKLVTGDLAALAALEGYYNPEIVNASLAPPATPTLAERFAVAKQRAEEVASQNYLTSRYKERHLLYGDQLDVAPSSGNSPGYIQSGIWWTAAECTTCACGTPPCFEVCPGGSCSGNLATSMRVVLRSKDSQPVENIFGKIFGINYTPVSASSTSAADVPATAIIVPRHIVMLVDVGRGTVVDSTSLSERGGGNVVSGPRIEPAATILDSAYYLLDQFIAGASSKDKIAWILFDQQANHGGYRTQGSLLLKSNTAVSNMRSVLNPTNSSTRSTNNLLPLADTGADLPNAINAARSILAADPNFANVSNGIVLLSNGLFDDCLPQEAAYPTRNCPKFTIDIDPAVLDRQHQAQSLDMNTGYTALTTNLTASANAGTPIDLNVIFLGSSAHTVLRQPNTGSLCMTEKEMRNQTGAPLSIVLDNSSATDLRIAYSNLGTAPFPRRYFKPVEWLYSAARAVGGGWLPLMTPCNADISNSCSSGGGAVITSPPLALNSSYMDGAGRVFCDPAARSIQAQLNGFVARQILNPAIKLVAK